MSIVKNTQLQEILEDLLAKIKTNTRSTYNNITFNTTDNSLELTSIDGNTTSCLLDGLVDIDSEQTITGTKIFNDITINTGGGIRFFNDTPATHTASQNNHYCGTSNISFDAGTFIEDIIVILNENNVSPGDMIDGVNVYSAHGDHVRAINHQDATFEVIENPYPDNISGTVAVRIPMNIRLDVNTWFLVGARYMKWDRAHHATYAAGGNTFLHVGQHLTQTTGNYLCKIAYVTRSLSVANLISKIPAMSNEMSNMYVNAEVQNSDLVFTKQDGTTQTVTLPYSAAPKVIDINLDDNDILNVQKDDNSSSTIDLGRFVSDWTDLPYTSQQGAINIFDIDQTNDGYVFVQGGTQELEGWKTFVFDAVPGEEITIIKDRHDSSTIAFLDETGTYVDRITSTGTTYNNRQYYQLTIPNIQGIAKCGFNLHPNSYDVTKAEVYRSRVLPTRMPVPAGQRNNVLIDGNNVSLTFDNSNTDLNSEDVISAIKETYSTLKNMIEGITTTISEDEDKKINKYGSSQDRPRPELIKIGFTYYDQDITKLIVWTGSEWRDAMGEIV